MILALVLLYVVSLVYISITERFRSYASLVGLQGWLLLAIALVRLQQIEIWSLLFVVAETLLFKAIVVPAILFAVIRRTKINRIAASGTSQFNSLVLSLAALVASISVTYCIAEETINLVFFGVALYALLSGLILTSCARASSRTWWDFWSSKTASSSSRWPSGSRCPR